MVKQWILLIIIAFSLSFSSPPKVIQLNVTWEKEAFELGKTYYLESTNDSITINTFKFHISNIEFFQGEQLLNKTVKTHHLIDLEQPSTLAIAIPSRVNKSNKIVFTLGVDSLTNVLGAQDGDLDPMNGMYWTWQSGYINLKLEGKCATCNTRKNEFKFHLGGYQYPYNTAQKIVLDLQSNADSYILTLPLDEILSSLDLAKDCEIMSPNEQALNMSKTIATHFSIY